MNIGSKSYVKEKMTKQARIKTNDLKIVHSNLPATILEKLWHLDAWIYQVISSVIGSVRTS